MNKSLRSWFRQVTTGHGVAIISSALAGVLSGTVTLAGAAPFLLAGVIALFWPENTALQTAAQSTATDVASMVAAYNNRGAPPAPKPSTRKPSAG